MRAYFQLIRPRQWLKNLILFAALLFAGKAGDLSAWELAASGMLSFILLSSCVYAFNDVHDAESDRKHPRKRMRPVASGRLGKGRALGLSGGLGLAGLSLAFFLGQGFFVVALTYLAESLLYTLWLKHQVILDVFSLAAGFVLRAVAGALAIQVSISSWLLVCTTLLALFLGLSKRRAEIDLLKSGASSHRRSLDEYSPQLLDQMISIVASATVVAYSIYAFTAHGQWMMLTSLFVLYGILRYLYLSHKKGLAGQPEEVLWVDRPMQICMVLWALCAGIILEFVQK